MAVGVSWRNDFDPSSVVRKIDESVTASGKGGVKIRGGFFQHYEHLRVLHSMLQFPSDIPEAESRSIVDRAVLEAERTAPVTAKKVLAEVNKLASEYQQRPSQIYVMVTSVSLDPRARLPVTKPLGATITFKRHPAQRFLAERAQIEDKVAYALRAELPASYLFVRVHCRAKSDHAAANLALDALDLIRGILNWYENERHFTRMSSGRPQPVNKIVLGPLHTLHEPAGPLATETWWYEPHYRGPLNTFNPSSDLPRMLEFLKQVRARLRMHPYRQVVEGSIIRYVRALDESNWNGAFLRLWGVLEHLTSTGKEGHHITVRRTSFLFDDHQYHKQVLNHLRAYRNRSVHEDASSDVVETYMYQLKNYVEALIRFHLVSGHSLGSLENAVRFLSLPPDAEMLKSQLNMLELAREFRRG